jgi:hypothetical protein
VKPETRTVTQLFERGVRYVVPLYQRPYVWREAAQWQPLWDDLVTLLEHQAAGNLYYSHFLGAVVLEQETQAPGEIPLYWVIDGQQRLTTLQIILAAAANVAAEFDAANEGEIIRELIRNDSKKASGDDVFKVWPTNTNRAAFKAVVSDGGPPADRKDDPNNRIDEAYAFFEAQIREWATEMNGISREERLRMLRITLCDLLKVVSITLEADDNAQVIFETLNARGTPLLALDLVKNSVFREARIQELDTEALYEEVWKPEFDGKEMDAYWRTERRQGRLRRAGAEFFLMHWLAMQKRGVVPATELFTTFRSDILNRQPAPRMDELISELCRDAKIMRGFDTQEPGSVEATFFERLDLLDTSTVIPLVLFLFREPAVSPESRRRCLQMLESWLVRRTLMNLTTRAYNQLVPAMLTRVAEDIEHADDVLLSELRSGTGDISRWPSDDELGTRLRDRDLYGWVRRDRIVMVMSAVEETLYTSKVDLTSLPEKLSIEHVMPQSWKRNWPLPAGLVGEELEAATVARNGRIHRLGNLTIVTQPLNAALSNASWAKKQKQLNPNVRLLMNVRLLEKFPDVFDEAAIDSRGAWLAQRILSVWRGPDSWHV